MLDNWRIILYLLTEHNVVFFACYAECNIFLLYGKCCVHILFPRYFSSYWSLLLVFPLIFCSSGFICRIPPCIRDYFWHIMQCLMIYYCWWNSIYLWRSCKFNRPLLFMVLSFLFMVLGLVTCSFDNISGKPLSLILFISVVQCFFIISWYWLNCFLSQSLAISNTIPI